jgi:hypothetical protein
MRPQMKWDQIWKWLVYLWAIVSFVVVVAFFFGGEWARWQEISSEYRSYAKVDQLEAYARADTPGLQDVLSSYQNFVARTEIADVVRSGDQVALQLQSNLYLFGDSNSSNAGTSVVVSGTDQGWTIIRK